MGAYDPFGYCHFTIYFYKDYHIASADLGTLNKLLFHCQRLECLWVFYSKLVEIRCDLLHKTLSIPEAIQCTSFVRVVSERTSRNAFLTFFFVERERFVHPFILVFHVTL